MFKYALKSMWSRKVVTILFTTALVVALTISMLAVNISSQINEGFYRADSKYDVVVGPSGSDTQLVMSSLFFSDMPVGKISYEYVEKLKERGDLKTVIPFGMADNYRGARLIGTKTEMFDGKKLVQGELFTKPFEAIVGYNVAKAYGLTLGQQIITSHGIAGAGGEEHTNCPYTVVGILDKTTSAYDNVVFTDIESIWQSHGEESAEEHAKEVAENGGVDEDLDTREVTAVLVRSGNMATSNDVIQSYNKGETQAVNPTGVMRKLMSNIDVSKQVALLLCGIILILSLIIICIMTVQMLNSINTEVKTLRFLGISKGNISKYVIYQNIMIAAMGAIISYGLSRGALIIANTISSKLGIILDIGKVYQSEFITIGVAIAVCIAPVIIYIHSALRKELSNEE